MEKEKRGRRGERNVWKKTGTENFRKGNSLQHPLIL